MYRRWVLSLAGAGVIALLFGAPANALTYGAGTYGTCQYGTCSISITSGASVSLAVNPVPGSVRCTVVSNQVDVSTGASTGFTLTQSSTTAQTALADGVSGATLPAVSGTVASPVLLAADQWGFRVDTGAFGTGPTSAVSDAPIPSLPFASVGAQTAPAQVATSNAPANPTSTLVWYGMCVDMQQPAASYTGSILYTAVTN